MLICHVGSCPGERKKISGSAPPRKMKEVTMSFATCTFHTVDELWATCPLLSSHQVIPKVKTRNIYKWRPGHFCILSSFIFWYSKEIIVIFEYCFRCNRKFLQGVPNRTYYNYKPIANLFRLTCDSCFWHRKASIKGTAAGLQDIGSATECWFQRAVNICWSIFQ